MKKLYLTTILLTAQIGWLTAQINSTSFSTRTDFSLSGNGGVNLGSADLDGDGKKDIIVVSQGTSMISIFRNTSSFGIINSSSLATRIDITPGGPLSYVALADFDGDGKTDIATGSSSTNMVYVYRNLSTSGTISLGTKQSFSAPAGAYVYGIYTSDIDLNGKIDIITSNRNGNSFSFFSNTSSSGTINFSAASTNNSVGLSDPAQVIASDLDGDSKPDLVFFSNTGSKATVIRNTTSTPGSVSFASPMHLSASPYGGTFRGDVGDVDGDGKPDICMSSWNQGKSCIFQNTTSSGTLSFAAKVDFGSFTGMQSSVLKDLDKDGKPELIQSSETTSLSVRKNISSQGSIGSSSFDTKFDYSAPSFPAGILVEDIDGDGMAELISSNYNSASISIYKNNVPALVKPLLNKLVYCAGDSIMVSFQLKKTYNASNNIRIDLSNPSGSFSSIRVLGLKNSYHEGYDSIKLVLPIDLTGSSAYRIRIISTNPKDTSIISDTITINSTPAPTLTLNGKASFCLGENVTLNTQAGNGLSYRWQVGHVNTSDAKDTTASLLVNASGLFRIKETNLAGCIGYSSDTLITLVNAPRPTALFTSAGYSACLVGNFFTFINASTNTSNASFSWFLGEGIADTTSAISPTKTFTQQGAFSVKLVVMNSASSICKDSVTKTIIVYPQPKSGFIVDNDSQCVNSNLFLFQDTSLGSVTRFWNLGVGSMDTSSLINLSKTYSSTGIYTISLVAVSNFGCKDTLVKQVVVNPTPNADFITDFAQCFTSNNFVMTNTSSGSPTAYHWDFGNSATSTAVTPSVSYSSVGMFPIRLVTINSFGCLDTVVHSVRVKTNPATPFVSYSPDTIVCDNINIILKTNSPDTKSWLKNSFPLGVNADSIVVNNNPGVYSLKVTNSENCDATSNVLNLFFKTTPAKPIVSVAGNVFTSSAATGNQWYNTSGAIAGQTGQTYLATSLGQYYTMVTLNACTSPASDMVNFPATGVALLSNKNSISVYPNPNNGNFTIVLNKKIEGPVLVKVFDLTGRLVFEEYKSATDLSVQTNGLANGTYLVMISANNEQFKVKIAVNR